MTNKNDYSLEMLVVAPHPDDAEIWTGGLIAQTASLGRRVGIVDLCEGELGSRGSVAERYEESHAASLVLGCSVRENLRLPDGALGGLTSRPGQMTASEQVSTVVAALRRFRPEVLVVPYWKERHPDHVDSSYLLTKAIFLAALRKFEPSADAAPFVPRAVLYYQMRVEFEPSFIVDISAVSAKKYEAIAAYATQIFHSLKSAPENAGTHTLLSSEMTIAALKARDAYYGAKIGTAAGEAYLVKSTLPVNDPVRFFQENPIIDTQFFRAII